MVVTACCLVLCSTSALREEILMNVGLLAGGCGRCAISDYDSPPFLDQSPGAEHLLRPLLQRARRVGPGPEALLGQDACNGTHSSPAVSPTIRPFPNRKDLYKRARLQGPLS